MLVIWMRAISHQIRQCNIVASYICSPTPQDLLEGVWAYIHSIQLFDKKSATVRLLQVTLTESQQQLHPFIIFLNLNAPNFPSIAWFITFNQPTTTNQPTNQPTNQRQVKRSKSRERGVTGVVGVPWWLRVWGKGMGIKTVSVVGGGLICFSFFQPKQQGSLNCQFFGNFLGIFLLIVHCLAWQLKDPCTTFRRMWSVWKKLETNQSIYPPWT